MNELANKQNETVNQGFYCSLQGDSQTDRLKVYEAVSNSQPFETIIDKVINVTDVIIQPVEIADNKTGEISNRNRIVLVTEKGAAYGCTSMGVETSVKNLFGIVGTPPWNPALPLKPVKKKGNNGFSFTTLEVSAK